MRVTELLLTEHAPKQVVTVLRIQLCIVHMVRNSTKFVSYKDLKAICKDLKKIYTASTEEEALHSLDDFGETWNSKYSMIQKSWVDHWDDLSEFFAYPEEIRRVIYTTNAIESLNFSLRKVTKNRAARSPQTIQSTRSCTLLYTRPRRNGPCQ